MRHVLIALGLTLALAGGLTASDRVPGEGWMRFVDPADAGFDPAKLDAARATWEALPSSAFLVVADGAVVAAWGDVERRYMCHSVRKSFLSALYGIAWDRGQIELNRTMADLGIDDEPSPLLEVEQQARILDLLKARSAVYHPAAYAGRTDSAPRGSIGPGQAFGYNNWDFNTLATILIQETGMDVFEGFDEHFGRPLGMQDWRVSDGYYHYELDKSKYPAYPFRLSARDAARFGLLFAREGLWGEQRVLSKHWVRRSTALYSIDSEEMGYGFMWWVLRRPSLVRHDMVAALGVGNQMIAALPGNDMVIVNRADTYDGERTPTQGLLTLIDEVLAARTGSSATEPRLVPLEDAPADPRETHVAREQLQALGLVGEWAVPPASLGLPQRTTASVSLGDGHLVVHIPVAGTFRLYLQPDGSFLREDGQDTLLMVRDADGAVQGLSQPEHRDQALVRAVAAGDLARAEELLAGVVGSSEVELAAGRAVMSVAIGDDSAERDIRAMLTEQNAFPLERGLNVMGYLAMQEQALGLARALFELNTRLFPDAYNTWDSLGEVLLALGHEQQALEAYTRSLELEPDNVGARQQIDRLQAGR
jgi:CubicO group peptidase (beta-lactamase class C family)